MKQEYYGELLYKSLMDFRNGNLSLGTLVDDVESICDSLTEECLKERIKENWWTLEQVYAVDVLARGAETLPADASAQVQEAVEALEVIAEEISRNVDRAGD